MVLKFLVDAMHATKLRRVQSTVESSGTIKVKRLHLALPALNGHSLSLTAGLLIVTVGQVCIG